MKAAAKRLPLVKRLRKARKHRLRVPRMQQKLPLLAAEQAWAQLPEAQVPLPVRRASAQLPPEALPQER